MNVKADTKRAVEEAVEGAINSSSMAKDPRITDLRVEVVACNYDHPIIRLDTKQGIYGD